MLLRPNESICIQGAFFVLYEGRANGAATWEPVQRLGGSGSVFPKQSSKDKLGLVLSSFNFSPETKGILKEGVEAESFAVTHSTLLSCTILTIALFGFSVRIENSRAEFGTKSEDSSAACAPGDWQLLISSPLSDLAP